MQKHKEGIQKTGATREYFPPLASLYVLLSHIQQHTAPDEIPVPPFSVINDAKSIFFETFVTITERT